MGAIDPNPAHAGRGLSRLSAAGIEVITGILAAEATALNRGFNKWIVTGSPLVIAKCAMSLDGRITRLPSESPWLTGERSRADAHRLRAQVDAILIGAGTLRADNPRLTVRGVRHGAPAVAGGSHAVGVRSRASPSFYRRAPRAHAGLQKAHPCLGIEGSGPARSHELFSSREACSFLARLLIGAGGSRAVVCRAAPPRWSQAVHRGPRRHVDAYPPHYHASGVSPHRRRPRPDRRRPVSRFLDIRNGCYSGR